MSKITKNRLFELLSARHTDNPYSRLADIPTPNNFKDIQKACTRVKEAVLKNEQITIVGDYDVDGVVFNNYHVRLFYKSWN